MRESDSMKSKWPTVTEAKDSGSLVQVFPLLANFASEYDLVIGMDILKSWGIYALCKGGILKNENQTKDTSTG